jgi:hypothetical protein
MPKSLPGPNIHSISVGNNSKLPVETPKVKLTYTEVVSVSTAVEKQDRNIAASRSPEDDE